MRVFWRKVKWGQSLILIDEDNGHEEDLGGYRDTKRGIDALAKTFSYDPSRSQKGFPTIEEAKAFVESFRPWELFGAQVATVDPEVSPALDSATADPAGTPQQAAESMVSEPQQAAESVVSEPQQAAESMVSEPQQAAESMVSEPQQTKGKWQFWKKS